MYRVAIQRIQSSLIVIVGLLYAACNGAAPADDDAVDGGGTGTDSSGSTDDNQGTEPSDTGTGGGGDTGTGTGVGTDEDTDDTDDNPPLLLSPCEEDLDPNACFTVDETLLSAAISGNSVLLSMPVTPKSSDIVQGVADVSLKNLDGTVIGNTSLSFTNQGSAENLALTLDGLPDGLAPGDLGSFTLEYAVSCDTGKNQGARSLHYLTSQVQALLRGPDVFMAGETNGFRVYVQDPTENTPASEVLGDFSLTWEEEGVEQSVPVFTGKTDALGMLKAELEIPEDIPDKVTLKAEIEGESKRETVAVPISIKRLQNILVTTDKPIYQPGQLIHIRSLALRRPTLTPEAGTEVTIEVADSKGNKVFKEITNNDAFGIAHAEFQLATEVLLGTYTITVYVGDSQVEKTVTVDRYSLPKFDIDVETDKAFYAPGDVLSGTVDVQYFFGQSVVGGSVEISVERFDLEFSPFTTVSGTTDDSGLFDFEVTLPDYFVGQPLDDGNAFVLLSITVVDTAGQERVVELTRPVVNAAILPQVVPESGDVVPEVENVFYLLTTNPQGTPVAATSEVTVGDVTFTVTSDARGIATFAVTPDDGENIAVQVTSTDETGNVGTRDFSFVPGDAGAYVLLRTDSSVYSVGDLMSVSVICPDIANGAGAFKDRVYLDIIKDGRTVLMTTVELTDGSGVYDTAISPDLVGGFEVEAYYLTTEGNIMRDRKVVYVDPADGLNIDVTADQTQYAPAEEANLRFTVTTDDGLPVTAAIGLQVVDEAVFSLMEFKPGLEKVFYALEQDIMTPRYEVHGYDMTDVSDDPYEDEGETRQAVAELLFAAAPGGTFGVSVDTFATAVERLKSIAAARMSTAGPEIVDVIAETCERDEITTVAAALAHLKENNVCFVDPWRRPYRIDENSYSLTLTSSGPDEAFDTEDDGEYRADFSCEYGFVQWDANDDDGDWARDEEADFDNAPTDGGGGSGGGQGPRVRKDFPETLYVNPALITDGNGVADLTIPLADSITTWRLSALASSATGLLGSTQSGITVFQDFFVDIDFPAQLTQDDEVSIPIAIYNYLDESQTITLTVEEESWFELLDVAEKTVEIGPGEVLGESYTIRVNEVGTHALTVYGIGTTLQDAVQRRVEVVPNGKEILATQSGRLNDTVSYTASIPEAAIDNASKVMVKIYPGMLSQAVEGLDSLLQLPSGCFEQTSSTTYPNVLVLNYMMATGQITPEIELKAREYVNLGYQRLLTFEVDGGGFEWFGSPPAHNILTAYGLLEFSDMAKVHPVDQAIITRTQEWLAAQQESDGHYEPSSGGIAEGAINAYEDDVARTTAYITYALLESGYTGAEVASGIQWIKGNYQSITDNYGLAMIANALVANDPNDPAATDVLDRLHEARIEDDNGIHWTGTGQSTTYGTGDVIDIETTALVGYAMVRAGSHLEDVEGAMSYLIGNKDSFGNWHTTQATILTLRLMLATIENAAAPGPATVRVYAHDSLVETLEIDAATSDVLRLVDLGTVTVEGDNAIRIEIDGDSTYLYQIVSRHYMPWEGEGGVPNQGPLSLEVSYDKTDLYVDDIVTASVTVTNTVPDSVANMVLVDLGLPPGFELIDTDLQQAVDQGVLQKIEKTERQLTLYVEAIVYGEPLTLTYGLRALYPVQASSGEAETHPYYTPSDSTQASPTDFLVTE